jgi:uncharacterized Zn-finger protein
MAKAGAGQIKKISCSGDNILSKHPLIYLDIENKAHATCPYCGKVFINKKTK